MVEVIASQPVVNHVAEHDAVLRDGEERVHKILAVLVMSPVKIKSKASTDDDALGQYSLALYCSSLIACPYLQEPQYLKHFPVQ